MYTAVLCRLNQHPDVKDYVMTFDVKCVNPTIIYIILLSTSMRPNPSNISTKGHHCMSPIVCI